MSDTTLRSAILINGGNPLSSTDTLFPRELYITNEGKLLVGHVQTEVGKTPTASPMEITVGKAIESTYVNLERTGFKVKFTADAKILEGADISGCYVSSNKSLIFGSNSIKHQDGALQMTLTGGGKIIGGVLVSNTISGAKLNLSNASYGSKQDMNNIVNPQKGDIFIVI